ncbi:hypothetical protein E2C01_038820 [Portunus trituberculatus]|uniref:Uncharacterized protein n=1 Tax=Portunus trituberculatus TaxID=210409 RepID=A0A5B7FI62_PORTR|nr:hypothetical protein [Portunus trituberculatus]
MQSWTISSYFPKRMGRPLWANPMDTTSFLPRARLIRYLSFRPRTVLSGISKPSCSLKCCTAAKLPCLVAYFPISARSSGLYEA